MAPAHNEDGSLPLQVAVLTAVENTSHFTFVGRFPNSKTLQRREFFLYVFNFCVTRDVTSFYLLDFISAFIHFIHTTA